MRLPSEWKNALVDINRAAEFVGDDVDQYSELVDLGAIFDAIFIHIPTIDAATVAVSLQRTASKAEVPVPLHYRQSSDNATALWATTSGTGGLVIACYPLGGIQFLRIKCSENQSADREFHIRGY